jgi:SAM-dependent methyltransferase
MNKFNYENKQYLEKLDELPENYYSKYIIFIKKYINSDDKFLDIGCGNGKILKLLQKDKYKNGYGVDISKLFINQAKKNGFKNAFYYDGVNFPFKSNYFDLIGSFNVLEHVENPEKFISSQVKLLKKNGYIIIACPNFLSVLFLNNHRRLKGIKNKIINLGLIFSKLLNPNSKFEMMPPVIKENFEYDDDAIVVTNIIDIRRTLQKNKCKVIYESGFINYDSNLYKLINLIPIIKYLLPSCFIVARK